MTTILPPETKPNGLVWEACCIAATPWQWVHYDLVHTATRQSVATIGELPEDARELLVSADESMRLEIEGETMFGVLPGVERGLDEADFSIAAWRFAVQPGLLVTARRAPVTALGEAYRFLQQGGVMAGPEALIDRLIRHFTDTVRRELKGLSAQLDDAEDALLEQKIGAAGALGTAIGLARRRATRLKRVMAPFDRMFHRADAALPDWAIGEVYERASREIHAVADDLTAFQDRARSLQDELSARQAEQANQRLYIVSVVTALMLPATFVTGFFGMNTGGMFLAGGTGHGGTMAAAAICFVSLLAMFGFLKAKRLL